MAQVGASRFSPTQCVFPASLPLQFLHVSQTSLTLWGAGGGAAGL